MEKNIKIVVSVAIVAILVVAGVGIAVMSNNSTDGDLTVIDGRGKEVTIPSFERIASTSATVTEIICGLGSISMLAGATNDDNPYMVSESIIGIKNDGYPSNILKGFEDKTIKDIGGMYRIASEAILTSNPDLVIMGGYFNDDNTIKSLEDMGIPVVVCKNDHGLDEIYFNIALIGKVLGKEAEAKSLTDDMKGAIGKIVDWTKSLNVGSPKVAVFMGYGSEWGTYACGQTYIIGSPMITLLGGNNAYSSMAGMYEIVTTESVIASNPSVIIDSSPMSKANLDGIKTSTLTRDLDAAKADAIYATFDSCSTAFTLTTQGFVNAVGLMAMFMYEDQLDFEIDHYMGYDYMVYLNKFWNQIN